MRTPNGFQGIETNDGVSCITFVGELEDGSVYAKKYRVDMNPEISKRADYTMQRVKAKPIERDLTVEEVFGS